MRSSIASTTENDSQLSPKGGAQTHLDDSATMKTASADVCGDEEFANLLSLCEPSPLLVVRRKIAQSPLFNVRRKNIEEVSTTEFDDVSENGLASLGAKRRSSTRLAIYALIILIVLETATQRRMFGESSIENMRYRLPTDRGKKPKSSKSQNMSKDESRKLFSVSDSVKLEYDRWHGRVRNHLHLPERTLNFNFTNHPTRIERFPSVDERIEYYMGKWFNSSAVSTYGRGFEEDTYTQHKSTRQYGPFSRVLINLYNLDRKELQKCYQNKKELKVFSPYCRDYSDLAILLSEGTANVPHFIGDGLPRVTKELLKYPLFAKVRRLGQHGDSDDDDGLAPVADTIVLPLNRKRHFAPVWQVPENDTPWRMKIPKAVWRGGQASHDSKEMKNALVFQHLESKIVDAKFSKGTEGLPSGSSGSYVSMKDQLKCKYLISIEGNDVSSGLKWMLFSESVVLTPPFDWESWAMEGKLQPYVHYIPIRADMSDVEAKIAWAESHPEETRLISERSTLFMYDLLFSPEAADDEKNVMVGIMERFEQNFGSRREALRRREKMAIRWDRHLPRTQRFPSVDERVEYLMSGWHNIRNPEGFGVSLKTISDKVSQSGLFLASGRGLEDCSAGHDRSQALRRLCASSLPDFDERVTADLKSCSFKRLQQSKLGNGLVFAANSSWADGEKGRKDSKRVLLDDSPKVICFEDCIGTPGVPFFSPTRFESDAIVWPFDLDQTHDFVDKLADSDVSFEDKRPSIATVSSQETRDSINIKNMLQHRYLRAEKDLSPSDLAWMLYSQSVVLIPEPKAFESWLMESRLEPHVHYLPVGSGNGDAEVRVEWCEENADDCKMISERATLFVYDLLFDEKADKDNREVKFRVHEKYSAMFD